MPNRPGKFSLTVPHYRAFSQKNINLLGSRCSANPCIFIRFFLFSAKDLRICPTHFKQMFPKPLKAKTLDDSVLRILKFCRRRGAGWTKNTTKRRTPTQCFSFSVITPNIKNRNNSLISPINSEVNDIIMSLNVFDLNPHRFAHMSNILNFFLNVFQDCIQPFGHIFLRCKPL